MQSVMGIRNGYPSCRNAYIPALKYYTVTRTVRTPSKCFSSLLLSPKAISSRHFSHTRHLQLETGNVEESHSRGDIEKIVRDARQRFRDTLPKGYLTSQEYQLYERLYGPPLRETEPEDVGIHTHADMGAIKRGAEGTVLRQLEGGSFEELSYTIDPDNKASEVKNHGENDTVATIEIPSEEEIAEKTPTYVDAVARSQREHDALDKLYQDFQAAQKRQEESEALATASEDSTGSDPELTEDWDNPLDESEDFSDRNESGEIRRFHRYTLEGRFHGNPVEVVLPFKQLLEPINALLDRTHLLHVKQAAEAAFGGRGLPTSPATPAGMKSGRMGGVGLPPDQRHMTEIEADAFLASYLPPAYASVISVLGEVRKRVGREWIQSRLKGGKDKGLSILDAGSGGAGLVAWDQVIQTEWDLLKEAGEVTGANPPGKKTVVVGSDRLRNRIKTFLDNTTFLPRLPDYEHSGAMQGQHLDAGDKQQPRKSYDVIIASHLFLKEKQDHYRQAVLNNLWSLLNKDGGILIVLEKAHPRGFEAVAHVRDTILKDFLLPLSREDHVRPNDFNPTFHRELEAGRIIAPCTNHNACPMYKETGKSTGRKDFCHFSQRFVQPSFYGKMLGKQSDNQGDVDFSYVAIQRGVTREGSATAKEAADAAFSGYEQSAENPDMLTLPRIILPPLKRKGHVTLDVCTAEGKTERWTVPKSFSKLAYHDARKSRWGDLWALGAKTRVLKNVRTGGGPDDGGKRSADGKKPRKVEISMDGGRMTANEKNAPRERRSKGKEGKKQDLIRELLAAEHMAEEELEQELDAEAEAAVRGDEEAESRKRSRGL